MAEPQPPGTHEGADVEDETPALPKTAEDRKAAAAMSSMSAREEDGSQPGKNVDQAALGKAMQNLDIEGGKTGKSTGQEVDTVEKKKTIKVDQADVALLVEELEVSKIKATDLLKSHDGDAVNAMQAFVMASA